MTRGTAKLAAWISICCGVTCVEAFVWVQRGFGDLSPMNRKLPAAGDVAHVRVSAASSTKMSVSMERKASRTYEVRIKHVFHF